MQLHKIEMVMAVYKSKFKEDKDGPISDIVSVVNLVIPDASSQDISRHIVLIDEYQSYRIFHVYYHMGMVKKYERL